MYVELGVGLLEMELQFGYLILGVGVARAVLCKRYVTQGRGGFVIEYLWSRLEIKGILQSIIWLNGNRCILANQS